MILFALSSAALILIAVAPAARRVPVFVLIAIALHVLVSTGAWMLAGRFGPLMVALQGATVLHLGSLMRGRKPPAGWRELISLPASWFIGVSFTAIPWSLFLWIPEGPPLPWAPFALGSFGFFQSLVARPETVVVHLDRPAPEPGVEGGPVPLRAMVRRRLGFDRAGDPGLRIVQIADPHLGPFMSSRRLHRICRRAVAARPHLIVLTGDLLTREHNQDVEGLTIALAPLRNHSRVYACLGNHDLEALPMVRQVLRDIGAKLLIDASEVVDTAEGPVQVVGLDHRWRDRAAGVPAAMAAMPRVAGALRLVLLHDPGAFRYIADGDADLVLSGHTHGGQLGLVSLGLGWTAARTLLRIPDHGPWAMGRNRLYVHRAQGHYGFPLRMGVPGEESVLVVAPRAVPA